VECKVRGLGEKDILELVWGFVEGGWAYEELLS